MRDKRSSNIFSLIDSLSCYHIILILIFIVLLFELNILRNADADLWGHIYFGKQILQNLLKWNVPFYDLYSYTAPKDYPWISHEWLSQVIFYLVYSNFGSIGLISLRAILGLIILIILFKTISGISQSKITPILLLGMITWILRETTIYRPQIFTYLLLSLFVYFFTAFEYKKKKILQLLPFLMVIFTNIHGGFLACLGFFTIYVFLEWVWCFTDSRQRDEQKNKTKYLFWICCLSFAATLVNPYTYKLWPWVIKSILDPTLSNYLLEWSPLMRWYSLGLLYCFYPFLTYMTVLYLSIIWRTVSEKKIDISKITLVLLINIAPLYSVRHIPVFIILSTPIFAYYLDGIISPLHKMMRDKISLTLKTLNQNSHISIGRIVKVLFLLEIVLILILLPIFKKEFFTKILVNDKMFPVRAVKFLKENNIRGKVFCYHTWGEYLTWKLYPEIRVFIDGRNDTAYPMELLRKYLKFELSEKGAEKVLEEYPPDVIILPVDVKVIYKNEESENWGFRYAFVPAIEEIEKSGNWEMVYKDDCTYIFLRKGLIKTEKFKYPRYSKDDLYFP